MRWMIRNSCGKQDAMLTFCAIGLAVVVIKVLMAGVSLSDGAHSVTFGTIDGSIIAALLTPTLGSYTARRYTETKFGSQRRPPPTEEAQPSQRFPEEG